MEVPCKAEKFPAQSATMGRKGNEDRLLTGVPETQRKHTHQHTNAHTHVHVHARSIRLHQFHWLYSELAGKSLRKQPFLLSWQLMTFRGYSNYRAGPWRLITY